MSAITFTNVSRHRTNTHACDTSPRLYAMAYFHVCGGYNDVCVIMFYYVWNYHAYPSHIYVLVLWLAFDS